MSEEIWLIGTGYMGKCYAKVLQNLNLPFKVIGNSKKSVEEFKKEFKLNVFIGGVEKALSKMSAPTKAIIATNISKTIEITNLLITQGTKNCLIEKPGSLYKKELENTKELANRLKSKIWIAYNRRFYSSVNKLRELAELDGGIKSLIFEFTEWSHKIKHYKINDEEKKYWLIANSSHVIDLVFNLIGMPKKNQFSSKISGSIEWHPSASCFYGSGISTREIPFTYNSNWAAPGRWGIEVMTNKNRYILSPLEKLQVIKLGNLKAEYLDINDKTDENYKPGIYLQTKAFIANDSKYLCSINTQCKTLSFLNKIGGYK